LGQPLQNGQDKGRRLPGAGLSYPHYVVAFEHGGDRLLLYRRGRDVPGRLDARANARIKRELFEIQV
jgi:hypothetical protein